MQKHGLTLCFVTLSPDFAFLAGLAYRGRGNITESELSQWFNGTAVDRDDIVTAWWGDVKSAVSFKMVTFPDSGNFSYVLIRGTTNNWDMLTDAQLWSAAILMQGLRELLPIGSMWTPVIDNLINVITVLESESINRVSFYRDTTAFVQQLQSNVPETYAGVGVTGHSLGGVSLFSGVSCSAHIVLSICF
jgi:lipase ATG15